MLIHGCHLQANQKGKKWEYLAYGVMDDGLPSLDGRAAMGIKIAFEEGAERIFFGTGASDIAGVKEGQYTYIWALDHVDDLAELLGIDAAELRMYLERVSVLDLESQNTTQELQINIATAMKEGLEKMIIVSSPWHIQRCLTEALKISATMRADGHTVPDIRAAGSYGSTEGIVIIEPSHRGDMPVTTWPDTLRPLFRIKEEEREEAERGVAAAITEAIAKGEARLAAAT